MILKVALTGGIGSGKSVVADEFVALGVPIIDADVIAKELLSTDSDLIAQIIAHFGNAITEPSGTISRAKLRELVFQQPAAKTWLEQTMHPKITALIMQRAKEVTAPYYIVVIPLLIETGLQRLFQQVIVVDVPIELQRQRVLARDRVSEAQVEAIIASQASRAERLHYADHVIDNSGDFLKTTQQIQAIERDLALKY